MQLIAQKKNCYKFSIHIFNAIANVVVVVSWEKKNSKIKQRQKKLLFTRRQKFIWKWKSDDVKEERKKNNGEECNIDRDVKTHSSEVWVKSTVNQSLLCL